MPNDLWSEAWSKYDLARADTAVWPRVNNPSTSPLVCPVPATIANVNGIKGPKLPSKRATPRTITWPLGKSVGRSGATASNRNVLEEHAALRKELILRIGHTEGRRES
jgi:hypothetical protein